MTAVNNRWLCCGDYLYQAGMKDVMLLLENKWRYIRRKWQKENAGWNEKLADLYNLSEVQKEELQVAVIESGETVELNSGWRNKPENFWYPEAEGQGSSLTKYIVEPKRKIFVSVKEVSHINSEDEWCKKMKSVISLEQVKNETGYENFKKSNRFRKLVRFYLKAIGKKPCLKIHSFSQRGKIKKKWEKFLFQWKNLPY